MLIFAMLKNNVMEQKKKRIRRTKLALEKDIFNALKVQIEEVGFHNIKLNNLIAEANIEPNVFYKRFENIDEMLDIFVHKYDFWLTEVSEMTTAISKLAKGENIEQYYVDMLEKLSTSLYKNKVMQKLLLWELSDENETTKRTAIGRETDFEELCGVLDSYFEKYNVENIRTITALLIGGIYYLILHKDRSTFCGIDYSKREGKRKLQESIGWLTRAIFAFAEHETEIEGNKNLAAEIEKRANYLAVEKSGIIMADTIKRLKSKGMSDEDIAYCTGLPEDIVGGM